MTGGACGGAAPLGTPLLPGEAYAAALAGLPGMGPARLTTVVGAMPPEQVWSCLTASGPGDRERLGALAAHLGRSGETLLRTWRQAAAAIQVDAVWDRLADMGLGVALHGTSGYPAALVGDIEPPVVVFHRGAPQVLGGPLAAIVGTRRCTSAGAGIAFELGRDLAGAGVGVVSGLASGIDAAAHRGALHAGGAPPVGVVATGLDVVYPPQQRDLWDRVAEAGLVLGEAPPGTRPERWRFPARNRIIAALADVVVVVESHARGGALHTVDEADRRAVDVMAVPGSVRSSASAGTNDLLAEGRAPVRDAGDVLTALSLDTVRTTGRPPDERPPPSRRDAPVLEAVGWQPCTLDQLMLRTGRELTDLVEALNRLAAAGWVACRDGWYERVVEGCGRTGGLP